ncbi:MAG: phosphomannomutase/phosphoglucomutase [Methylophaga sp.]|nr:phosphomannomutase/phosphoglucomutase [Methylophaga sp.]
MANTKMQTLLQKRLQPNALMLLILLILAAVAVTYFVAQQQANNADPQSANQHQQRVSQQAAALATIIAGWQQQAADPQAITNWPAAKIVCMIENIPTTPQTGDCLPISYATLLALRQAASDGQADVAVMQPGTDKAYVQIVRQQDSGFLLLALSPDILKNLTQPLDANLGYWTINQGGNANLILVSAGSPQPAQQVKTVSSKIAGSHWQLNLLPAPVTMAQFNTAWLLPAILLAIIIWWPLAGLLPSGRQSLSRRRSDKTKIKPAAKSVSTVVADDKPESASDPEQTHAELNPKSDMDVNGSATDHGDTLSKPEDVDLLHDEAFDTPRSNNLDETVNGQATPDVLEFNLSPAAAKPVAIDAAIFKTYDIRGIVDSQLTTNVMQQLGQAIGSEAQARGVQKMVVARDGRASSEDFAKAMMQGINDSGCDVIDIGALPTPVLYFAAEHFETRSGVMITGSHNPANYNGVKIVIDGETLSGEAIQALKQRLDNNQLAKGQGSRQIEAVLDDYLAAIAAQIKLPKPIKVVVDCGNGIAGVVAPQLLKLIGCEITPLFCDVDSSFPNHHPNPGQPENLQALIAKVAEIKADIGLAFDGDGDRLGVVMADGEIIWPDRLLILFAQALLAEYPGETVLFDVKSTGLLNDIVSRAGGKPIMVASGHSLIKKALQEHNAKLAGELSGHLFFADRWYGFDDALYAACRLLELLAADPQGRTPAQIFAAQPQRVNTPEIHIAMDEAECRQFMQRFIKEAQFSDARLTKIDGLRVDFANGWGLARASNTVPGLTLRFEAGSEADLQHIKQLFMQQMLQVKPTLSLHL